MAAHARLKIEFTEGDMYENLMSRFNFCFLRHLVPFSFAVFNRLMSFGNSLYEPPHDKINKMTVRPAETKISLV